MSEWDEEELRQLFTRFDADASGAISVDELSQVVKESGLEMTQSDLLELVQQVDGDGSGEIEFDEFKVLMNMAKGKFSRIVAALKDSYLDEKARAAGAADVIWYTDEMLVAREKLKADEAIRRAVGS
eukprot:3401682-Prymnesium_polylepis.1